MQMFMQMFNVSTLCMQMYQIGSVKAVVEFDFPVDALSANKNPY